MLRWIFAVCVLAGLTLPARAQTVSDDEKKEGFVTLFDGKTFNGWRFSSGKGADPKPKNWKLESGVILLTGGGSPHLASQWDYEDFDVRLQWRPHKKGYNSGFYIRSGRNVGANQINLAEKDAGHLMGGAKGGPAVPNLQNPPGEWNEWRVLAMGDKVTFWCNGKQAWEVTGFKDKRGYLGLQAEGAAIDFRNLRIKEIGFERINFGMAEGWQSDGLTLVGSDAAPVLKSPMSYKDYTLRLEYTNGSKAVLNLRGKTWALPTEEENLAKRANPSDPFNYLEVTVRGGKAQVLLNGAAASAPEVGAEETAPEIIAPVGRVTLRNIRIRAAQP
jgi:hypothetical protein